jgi:hypothetical protein
MTMPNANPWTLYLWGLLASLAGALTALSARPFKNMTRSEIALALTVGASFAIFVGPWVAKIIFGDGPMDIRVFGGVLYLMATGSNILIPMAVKWFGRVFGASNGESRS